MGPTRTDVADTTLRLDRIHFREAFEAAAPEAFKAFFDFLIADGFHLDPARSRLAESLPTLDKLAWRPDVRELAWNTDGEKIGALSMVHHSMHGLVARRYGSELEGRPQLTLLSESMASCLQLYFTLCMVNELSSEQQRKASAAPLYGRVARLLGVDLAPILAEACRDPFLAYRRAVRDMMHVYQEVIEFDRRIRAAERAHASELDEKLRAIDGFVFVRTFDYGNNLLYVKSFCGLESSGFDTRAVEDCFALLDRGATMTELVASLRASRSAG